MFMRARESSAQSRRLRHFSRMTVLIASVAAAVFSGMPVASAGTTIVNGSECVPFVSLAVVPAPTTPVVFPYGGRLDIYRNGSDWNLLVSCPFRAHSGAELATGNITFALVDGNTLYNVRLCFGSYYSDGFACGPAVTGATGPYFVNPPSPKPAGSAMPFIIAGSTLTAAAPSMKVRSYTAFWSVP